MKKVEILIIFIVTFLFYSFLIELFAQDGLSQNDYSVIDRVVQDLFGENFQRSGITKVDSAIGNLYVSDRQIDDPYGTLKKLLYIYGQRYT